MQKIKKTIELNTPISRAFEFLNDPPKLLSIWPSMIEVRNVERRSDGSHDFEWTYKMAGLRFEGRTESLKFVPNQLLEVKNTGGIPSTFRWTFEGADGTKARVSVEVEYTIPVPVLGKLAEHAVHKMNEREMETVLANLKTTLEAGAAAQPAAQRPRA